MRTVVVSILLTVCPTIEAIGTDLYKKNYDESGSSGKPLSITIRETERAEHTSTFVVELRSGASVPSTMVIARACYDVAKLRKKPYFINLKEWEDNQGRRHYVIGYSDKKEPKPIAFFKIDGSKKESHELRYLGVEDFDFVFGSK